jgi:hypothetical protein
MCRMRNRCRLKFLTCAGPSSTGAVWLEAVQAAELDALRFHDLRRGATGVRAWAESDVPAARSEAGTSVAGRCRLVANGEREVDDLVTVTRPHGAISARLNALVSPPAPPGTDDRHHAARSACGLWLRGCGREAQ